MFLLCFKLLLVTSYCALRRKDSLCALAHGFCVSRKGRTGGGGLGHPAVMWDVIYNFIVGWKQLLYFSNSHRTIGSSERNKYCPQIVPTTSNRSTCTRMRIISYDGQRANARAVCVVQLISTAGSRTGRLHVLLTVSNSRHCITRTYLIQPSLMSAGFPKK